MRSLSRAAAAAAFLLAAAPHVLTACASAPPSPAPDPRAWAPVTCENCAKSGVTVETRRSVDEKGRAGRYVFARVSNLNSYAVTFTLDLQSYGPHTGDPDFLSRQWRVTLPPSGEAAATTLLSLSYSDIQTATVSGLERF